MDAQSTARWMLSQIEDSGSVYQEEVVQYLVSNDADNLLRENSDGNVVLGSDLLTAFRKLTEKTVVWVGGDKYWRFRDSSDGPGRQAEG